MRKFLILVLLLSFGFVAVANDKEVLDNQAVVDMISLGFDSEIVVSKINSSKVNFDVSVAALMELKGQGIETSVLSAMIERQKLMQESLDKSVIGIYMSGGGEGGSPVKLLPAVFSATKTRGSFAAQMSFGIASEKVKSTLSGTTSSFNSDTLLPTFDFYFQKFEEDKFHQNDWWFRYASSPNEFVLVKLKTKKTTREMETGKVNTWVGGDYGVDEKVVIKIKPKILEKDTLELSPMRCWSRASIASSIKARCHREDTAINRCLTSRSE